MLKGARTADILRQPFSTSLRRQAAASQRLSAPSIRAHASRSATRPQPTQIPRQRWGGSTLRAPGRRYNGSKATEVKDKAQQKAQGLSARLKELSRKYGWAAVGVYLGLSALDFPFCFLAVRWLGTERIAAAEHWVVSNFWSLVGAVGLDMRQKQSETPAASREGAGEMVDQAAAGESEQHDASIWTQLILAYGVHKSLIFFRVPVTAAITPKIVKWLRARGWKIGNPKA